MNIERDNILRVLQANPLPENDQLYWLTIGLKKLLEGKAHTSWKGSVNASFSKTYVSFTHEIGFAK